MRETFGRRGVRTMSDEMYLFVDQGCTLEEMCELEDMVAGDGMALDWDDIIETDGGLKVRMVPL